MIFYHKIKTFRFTCYELGHHNTASIFFLNLQIKLPEVKYLTILFILLFTVINSEAQNLQKNRFRVVCYNVENYFDCIDDSLTNDSEYLPGGIRGWNYEKYRTKQVNIAKVLAAIGEWDAPAIVGLCEIESRKGMNDLIYSAAFKNFGYKFVHYESPDARGVDVTLLYRPEVFKPEHHRPVRIIFPQDPNAKTRDILYVKGKANDETDLHFFVCHFPSRLGGELESEDRRLFVVSVLKEKTDSIFAAETKANIVIMGDFNDYPTNKSMLEILKALPPNGNYSDKELYNLMFPIHTAGKGSHKHEGEWGALDQIIVSGNLLDLTNNFYTLPSDVQVFDAPFLLVPDEKFLGKKPFRTYEGMRYIGGFADHLPVFVDFWY